MKNNKFIVWIFLALLIFAILFLAIRQNNRYKSFKNDIMKAVDNSLIQIDLESDEYDERRMSNNAIYDLQSILSDKLRTISPAIVGIYTKQAFETDIDVTPQYAINFVGNGVVIDSNGYIVTNKHVLQDSSLQYFVDLQGVDIDVQNIWFDKDLDLAIIKVNQRKLYVPEFVSVSDLPEPSQLILSVYYDSDQEYLGYMIGMITAMNLNLQENMYHVNMYRTSLDIQKGFSGSPVLDLNGRVVGLNIAKDTFQDKHAFSLPITDEFIKQSVQAIKDSQNISRPDLGIKYVQTVVGVEILDVIPYSMSEQAGLVKGDIIIGLNNKDLLYTDIFFYLVHNYLLESNSVLLNIKRGDKLDNVKLRL